VFLSGKYTGGSWPGNAVSMGQEFHIIAVCAYSLMV
jgi:hypothetical protein